MQRLSEPVDLQHVADARRLAEYVERRHGPVERVVGAQQPLVADRPHMRQAEHRLKHARQLQLPMLAPNTGRAPKSR